MNGRPQQKSGPSSPGPSGLVHPSFQLPFVGDVLRLSPKVPSLSLLKIGKKLGTLFEVSVFGKRVTFASDPAVVGELCDDSRFAKDIDENMISLRQVVGTGLVARETTDPIWVRASALMRIVLSQQSMRVHHAALVSTLDGFFRDWDGRCGAKPVDAVGDVEHLVQQMIGRVCFNVDFGGFPRRAEHPYIVAMQRILQDWQVSTIVRRSALSAPIYRGIDRRHDALSAQMYRYIDSSIAEIHANPDSARTDVVALAIRAGEENPEIALTDEDLRFQVINLVQGSESTNGLPVFGLFFLLQNPALLAKAREEISSVWGDDPDHVPDFEQVTRLRFVRRVIDESLRLWPTAGIGFSRAALEDTVIAGGHSLCKGDSVTVFNPMLHRNAEWGDDPERFDPDRFLPENIRKRSGHAYKPFGTGKRSCTGRALALHQSVLILAAIVNRYDLEGEPQYKLRVVERRGFHPVGFRVTLKRREPTRQVSGEASSG